MIHAAPRSIAEAIDPREINKLRLVKGQSIFPYGSTAYSPDQMWGIRAEYLIHAADCISELAAQVAEIHDVLGALLNCVDGVHMPDQLDRCKADARAVLAKVTRPIDTIIP